ncbi:hypothetical protein Tco_0532603 [Tanacetum coccineum]
MPMFAEAATDLREMKSGVALLWKAPKAYDSHRDKLLRRVDAETEHSWVAKKRSLGCLPFESFILGNVLCLRFSLIDDPKYHKSPFITFGCKVADGYGTHLAHCISELMRILMDVKGIAGRKVKSQMRLLKSLNGVEQDISKLCGYNGHLEEQMALGGIRPVSWLHNTDNI